MTNSTGRLNLNLHMTPSVEPTALARKHCGPSFQLLGITCILQSGLLFDCEHGFIMPHLGRFINRDKIEESGGA